MKPPLARRISLLSLGLVAALLLLCLAPQTAFAEAMDAAPSVHALSVVELVGLIAAGFIPALYMIGRARQPR